MNVSLCGDAYLLAVVDPYDNVPENDEANNVASVPVHMKCQQGNFPSQTL